MSMVRIDYLGTCEELGFSTDSYAWWRPFYRWTFSDGEKEYSIVCRHAQSYFEKILNIALSKDAPIEDAQEAAKHQINQHICQKCFGKDANYRIQRSFFHVADDRMLWCPKLAIELPDGSKVAQSRGWINELSADWNVIIEHNDSGATPVKHPDQPRYTFAKSKDERGEDAYRFIGIFQWSETTPSGEHIYKRMASDMKLK